MQLFGLSKCTYGWINRLPTWTDCKKLWNLTKHAQHVNHMANTWVRAILFGGLTHLSIVTACNLRRVVAELYKRGHDTWRYQAGTPLGTLRKWLCDQGWVVHSPWNWKFGDTSLTSSIEHELRDGLKLFCWDKFMHHVAWECQSCPWVRPPEQ